MNSKQASEIFHNRQLIENNSELLLNYAKSLKKSDKKNIGQLSLFDVAEVTKKPELVVHNNSVNINEYVTKEVQLLGLPVTYDPLDELWMHEELYCTNKPMDLLEFTEPKKNVVIMDKIVEIEKRTSNNGNQYVKLHTQRLGSDNYMYLWGKYYRDLISQVFINEIYLIQTEYKPAYKDFSKDSIIVTYLKNIKDVDIDTEYNRLTDKIFDKNDYICGMNNLWYKPNLEYIIRILKHYNYDN